MTRAAHAAATDAIKKLQEIAAKARGGKPDAYKVAGGKVSGPGGSMTFAQAAEKAIELGGKFDGHELPEDINNFTKTSATALVGQGLMAVAKDAYPRDGQTQSYVVGFAEVEVDIETGAYHVDRLHGDRRRRHGAQPAQPEAVSSSAARCSASATRMTQKWAYDQHYGVALARRFHHNKPPTILDAPLNFIAGRGRPARSGNADRRPRRRRAAGRRGLRRDHERDRGRARRRSFRRSPVTPDIDPDGARKRRQPDARSADGAHLRLQIAIADCDSNLQSSCNLH